MPILTRRGYTGRFRQNQAFGRPFRMKKHSPQAGGLAGWWPSLGQAGNILRDYAGIMGDMSYVNSPAFVTDPIRGKGTNFDSADTDHLTATTGVGDPLGKYPIVFAEWFRPDVVNANATLLFWGDSTQSSDNISAIIVGSTSALRFWYRNGTSNLIDTAALTAGKLYHYVGVVWNQDDVDLYLNGAFVGNGSTNTGGHATGFDTIGLGRSLDSTPGLDYDGKIFDSRTYFNRGMNASEVWHAYTQPWDLYEPIPRVFPVLVPAAAAGNILIHPGMSGGMDVMVGGIRG